MANTNSQMIFKRHELKYLLTDTQKYRIIRAMEPFMAADCYGRTTIRSLYFDTESYRLARRSIEKPVYKEKLRIRSYAQATPDSMVFVELKKKYRSVVYKRRLSLSEAQAMQWTGGASCRKPDSQISREIDFFLQHYETLHPVVFLSYEREAFFARDGSDFRVTFDEQIRCREQELSLQCPAWGTLLLPEDTVLMELKCSGGIPLWMTRILSDEHLYRSSFSKYGTAYRTVIRPHQKEVSYEPDTLSGSV